MSQRLTDLTIPPGVLDTLFAVIFVGGARKATKYLSEGYVIKASRRLFNGRVNPQDRIAEVLVTLGAPNSQERDAIKAFRKAKEPFPVKKVQVRYPAPR